MLVVYQLSTLAKQEGLLLNNQIGNCTNKSIKTALKLLVEQIYIV